MINSPKVLIAAAESAPFVKTGGLADVVGTLPQALKAQGMDVAVILPKHSAIKNKYQCELKTIATMSVQLGWRNEYLGIEMLTKEGINYYFIDNEEYFGGPVYLGGNAESEQYMFFCKSVIEALAYIDFKPDIIHANDWHTAMIPMLLKTQYQGREQGNIKTVFTIHNLQYQGQMSFSLIQDMLSIDSKYFTPEFIEAYDCANMMKAALVFADKITTVSPTYAKEILHSYYGRGMEGILNARKHDTVGIVNGINTDEFNPKKDKNIKSNYGLTSIYNKYENKKALMKEMGLNISETTPVYSMVTRMTEQKGLNLVRAVIEEALYQNMAFVMLGSGDHEYEQYFNWLVRSYPDKCGVYIGYNDALAHRVYAGSDFLLMPSAFEPCGISQMIAQAYGTLPIVRETGGLKDTVTPYNIYKKEGNGFSFSNYNAHDMLHVMKFSADVYKDKPAFVNLMKNAMKTDNSFAKSASEYKNLYEQMMV